MSRNHSFFNVPIIAYDTSAISDTLGGSGILINDNDPLFTAMLIDKLVNDDILRSRVIEKQKSRLEDFRYEKIRDMFEMYLKNFLGK